MSTKRKNAPSKVKSRPKSRKVEYDEEDISSEHDSEVDDAEVGPNVDGEDAAAEDALADVSNMPELPAPEVISSVPFLPFLPPTPIPLIVIKRARSGPPPAPARMTRIRSPSKLVVPN